MSQTRMLSVGIQGQRSVVGPVAVGLVVLLLALVLGGLAGLGDLLISGFIVAAVIVLLALGFPRMLFWVALTGCLVLSGLLELYMPSLQVLRWAFAGAASLFLVSVALHQIWIPGERAEPQPALTWAMLIFVLVCVASLVANWRGGVAALAGAKNYFQAWGLFFGMAVVTTWVGLERKLPKALLAAALIQLPFVLHQFLFLAPLRAGAGGLTAVDVVAGTFGASFTGGGNNAALAMFLIIVTTVLFALWRTGALPARWLWLTPLLLLPIFLNESKISVVYLALAFAVVFRREIVQRPLRVVVMTLMLCLTSFGLILSYAALHTSSRANTPVELIEQVIRQNTQQGERYGKLDLNRTTSIQHWFTEQRRYPLSKTLLGHGPSASKQSSGVLDTSDNLASRRYPGMGIGVTSVSSLLWDVGVIGLLSVMAIFVSAFALAGRLARDHAWSPFHAGLFQGLQAGVIILALSLLHKPFFTFQLGYQVFLLTLLGYLVYASRHPVRRDTAPTGTQGAAK